MKRYAWYHALCCKEELARAALDSITYQITDIINVMRCESGVSIEELRVDGGPAQNNYLMQFQSNLLDVSVQVPSAEELSGIGAAYAAGIAMGIYDKGKVLKRMKYRAFCSHMDMEERTNKLEGWKHAIGLVIKA